MRPTAALPFVLALAAALSIPLVRPSTADAYPSAVEKSIKFFCGHTDFQELCINTIKSTAPKLKSVDASAVLSILMQAVEAKTREGRAFALGLTKHAHLKPRTIELLNDCAFFYGTALENLADATRAIKAGDDGTRDAMLSSMISNFGSCENGFIDFAIKSPMADRSEKLKNMVDNCLAIAT